MATQASDDIAFNYNLERALADRLRHASDSERRLLYATVYDEFYRDARNVRAGMEDARSIARQVRLATAFLPKGGRYLEIGAGNCRVASQVAVSASSAVAVEVSAEVVDQNLGVEIVLSDGITVPVPPASADLVYSHQLMEHLHPDDAVEQLRGIVRALASGGTYVCITPNRLTGPHDVSKYFTKVASGFHLREYTIRELRRLFLDVGFRDVRVALALGGEIVAVIPSRPYVLAENVVSRLPRNIRRTRIVRKFLDPGLIVGFK